MSKTRTTLIATAVISAALFLAGCAANTGTSPMSGMNHNSTAPSTTPSPGVDAAHNDSDVAFVTGMIPHHQQAVEMADMILKKDGIDNRVTALATRIKAAQDPEIVAMNNWLKAWGAPAADSMGDMPGMDMGNGMMSTTDMEALDGSTGSKASKLFLTQMTQHHQGAIAMAKSELAAGQNADAVALAKKIIADQTAEIAEMKAILAGL